MTQEHQPRDYYRVPAEWAPRSGTLLAWPRSSRPWSSDYRALVDTFRQLVSALREQEPVTLLVHPDIRARAEAESGGSGENLHIEVLPTNDIWMRDCAPIAARPAARETINPKVLLDGRFNGWGEKYPYELDRLVPTVLARRWKLPRVTLPVTVEGGAIETNGAGDLITTESVLLSEHRCGGETKSTIDGYLAQYLGASKVHWLSCGLAGDHTDGHIDNLVRFVSENTLVYAFESLPDEHPNASVLQENREVLRSLVPAAASSTDGRFEVTELPLPDVRDRTGVPLPASYCNFYIAPDSVLVPQFGDPRDERALGILRELFPGRSVLGIDCSALVTGGGTLHCVTQPVL